jgi:hypothetical protein
MRVLIACLAVLALGVAAPPALAANSIAIEAPATAQEGGVFSVHGSGNADEPGLFVRHYVQKADCPSTVAEAQQQPGAVAQGNQSFFDTTGAFSYDTTLSTTPDPNKPSLTGLAKVCAYLYREESNGTQTTLAFAIDSIDIRPKAAPKFGLRIPKNAHMRSDGSILIFATCPRGCKVTVTYKGLNHVTKTVKKSLGARDGEVAIALPLDPKTKAFVRKVRKKHATFGAKVAVSATAKPPSGAKASASKTVTVK